MVCRGSFLYAYLSCNLGDDLFVRILLERYRNHDFTIFARSEYKKIFKKFNNLKVIDSNRFVYKILYKICSFQKRRPEFYLSKKYASTIAIGGSIFIEPNYLPCEPYSKRPFFILGSNYGPSRTIEYRQYCYNLFSKCDDVCFRDYKSYKLFAQLSNVRVAPDIVFNLNLRDKKIIKKNIAVISLINLSDASHQDLIKYADDYNNYILARTKNYIKSNITPIFVNFCLQQGDADATKMILAKLNDEERSRVRVVDYNGNLDEVLLLFQEAKFVIGTRFHSIILGLLAGADVLPIVYSEKTLNMLNDLGFSEYISVDNMNMLSTDKSSYIYLDDGTCERLRDQSACQFTALDNYFKTKKDK